MQVLQRRPDLVGSDSGTARRRNANHQSRHASAAGKPVQRSRNGLFHSAVDSSVDIQQADASPVRPAFVKDFSVRRFPGDIARIGSVQPKEGLQGVRRHLVYIKNGIDDSRLQSRLGAHHRNLRQRIQRRGGLFYRHLLAESHTACHIGVHHLPEIAVEFKPVFAGLHRHRVRNVRLHSRLVGAMPQELHLHAKLVQ